MTELINGLHPYPSLRQYFDLDPVVFNDDSVFKLWGGKKTGYRRIEHLRKFLRFASPAYLAQFKAEDIFADTRPLTDMLLERCENAFIVGKDVSLDEIDIGTQTSFAGKETIKFKVEGDGVMVDALCDSPTGALFTYRFRKDLLARMRRDDGEVHESAPELSPLHERCLILMRRPCVRGKWRTAWMDNLFPSLRFSFYASKLAKFHTVGIVRGKRGFPLCAWQPVIKKKAEEARAKGTVKKASLLNDGTFGLFAISVYDNKPVHIFSTKHTDSNMMTRTRRWYEGGACTERDYMRLEIIHEYNTLMGGKYACIIHIHTHLHIHSYAHTQVSICRTGSGGTIDRTVSTCGAP